MEFGISSFEEVVLAATTRRPSVWMPYLTDETSLEVLSLGEHYRPNFIISAPKAILVAITASTKRIRLSHAVTVLN